MSVPTGPTEKEVFARHIISKSLISPIGEEVFAVFVRVFKGCVQTDLTDRLRNRF